MSEQVLDSTIIDRLEKAGGTELKTALIQMYLENTPNKMDLIHQGAEKSAYIDIEGAAHSLISSAGNLGGMQVSGLASKLEQAAIGKDMELIERLVRELDSAEEALQAQLILEMDKS